MSALRIKIVTFTVIIIGIIILIAIAIMSFKLFDPNPPEPKIKKAEFNFELTFEVNGEIHTINDTLVCTFAGFQNSAFAFPVKTRNWEEHFKSMPENGRLVIYQIDDTYSISLHTHGRTVMYLMSDPGGEGYPPDTEPLIAVFNSKIDNYDKDKIEILEKCGFKIIKWYCDPPIENSFK